jgi:glycerophosphoryl diester phosphodiesterase
MLLADLAARPVIAHRGNSAHAPENTFEAYDQAIALGADALEFDIRLTRDGVPVVIHDPTLDRTTNGRGPVVDRTLDELRALDAGARFVSRDGSHPYRGQGFVIPTLEEMVVRYPRIPFLIEVKVPEAVAATRRVLEHAGAIGRSMVDSTVHAAVAPFRGGKLATGASLDDVVRLLMASLVGRPPRTLPYEALCIPRWYNGIPVPVPLLARAARRAGRVTHVWTINRPSVARSLWRAGVQGIITDDPAPMLELRRQMTIESPPAPVPSPPPAPASS